MNLTLEQRIALLEQRVAELSNGRLNHATAAKRARRAREMRADGWKVAAIAAELGVQERAVYDYLSRARSHT